MDITIRAATVKDLEKIIHIESICFPPTEAATPQSLTERLAAFKQSFLVAESAGEVLGFINGCVTAQHKLTDELYASTKLHDEAAPCQMVFGLAVHPTMQQRGIAKILMQEFIKQAKARNKKLITLTCKQERIHFYEQFGYQDEGQSISTHGGVCWHDMTLILPDKI